MAVRVIDVASFTKFIRSTKGFDAVLDKIKILAIGNGKCSAELTVDESHTNPIGGLHGGLSTTLVDCISSFALMSQVEGHHVSVDIHMRYLKGAKIGDNILVDARVVRKGKTLAFLEVDITNKNSGDVLAKGSHTKFIL